MLTYLRGLNRSSMSEPELPFYLTEWGIKCPLAPICVGTQNGGSRIQSAFTLSLCRDRQTALSMCRDLTHTRREITAHLSCSHTPCCCCIPNKREEGVERAIDCDWVGDQWRGLPTSNSRPFLLCLSATASYYPSKLPLSSPRAPNAPHYWSITWLW